MMLIDSQEPLACVEEEDCAEVEGSSSGCSSDDNSDPILTSTCVVDRTVPTAVKSEVAEAEDDIEAALSEMMQTHPHHHHHQQHHMYHPTAHHHRPPQLQVGLFSYFYTLGG
jgi:hypothetical protein